MIEYLKEIQEHFEKWYTNEGCGVLAVVKGKIKWFPCDNVSKTGSDFVIDSKQYIWYYTSPYLKKRIQRQDQFIEFWLGARIKFESRPKRAWEEKIEEWVEERVPRVIL